MPHNQPVTNSSPVKRNFLNEFKIVQGKLKTAPLSYLQDQEKICQKLLAKFSRHEEQIENPKESHQQLTIVYVEILYRQMAHSKITADHEKRCNEIQAAFVAHLEKYPVKDSSETSQLKECLREMLNDKTFDEGKIKVVINVLKHICGDNNENSAEAFGFFTHYCFKNNLPYVDFYVLANEARKKLPADNLIKKWVGNMLKTIGNDQKSEQFKKANAQESKKEIPLYDDFVKTITVFVDLATDYLAMANSQKAKEHSEDALRYVFSHDQFYTLEQIFESLIKSALLNTKICLQLDPKNTSFAIQSYENISYYLLVHPEEAEYKKEKCQTTWLLSYMKHIVLPYFENNLSVLEKFKTVLTAHQHHVKFSDSFTFDDQKKLEEIMLQLKTCLPDPKVEGKKKKKKKKPKPQKKPLVTPPKKKKTLLKSPHDGMSVDNASVASKETSSEEKETISSTVTQVVVPPKADREITAKPEIPRKEPTVTLVSKKMKAGSLGQTKQPAKQKAPVKAILPLPKTPLQKTKHTPKPPNHANTEFKLDSADFPPLVPAKKPSTGVINKAPSRTASANTAAITQALSQKVNVPPKGTSTNSSVQNAQPKPTIIVAPIPINLGAINSQINSLQQSMVALKKDNAELIKQHAEQATVIAELKAQLQQVNSQQDYDHIEDVQDDSETGQQFTQQFPMAEMNSIYPQPIYPVMLVPMTNFYQGGYTTMFQAAPIHQAEQQPTQPRMPGNY